MGFGRLHKLLEKPATQIGCVGNLLKKRVPDFARSAKGQKRSEAFCRLREWHFRYKFVIIEGQWMPINDA